MKRFITLFSLLLPLFVNAQTIGFHENFEPPSGGDSVTPSGATLWSINTRIAAGGVQCDSNYVPVNDSSFLITNSFSCSANSFVILHFTHICKIELLDGGEVDISLNHGPWIKLTSVQYINPGNSQFVTMGNKFNSNTYPVDWQSTQNTAKPTNAWWKDEQFDISALAANVPDVRIRFKLIDGNANGANQNRGWFIDNIKVIMSFSELTPPTIAYINPLYLGTVYNLGPFNIRAKIDDASGIQQAHVYYKVNSGILDSVLMTVLGNDTMQGTIPAVSDSDTVKYYIRAADNSPAHNVALNPTTGFRTFIAVNGISFPYVDNFDGPSVLWHDSTLTVGTLWELGTPSYGSTNSAHSPPDAWDVDLTTTYGNSATCYLFSPIFDFSNTVNAKMSFWINFYTESCCDGVRLEYTTDGTTWNVLGTVGDPNATNWYTNSSVVSSGGKPVWTYMSNGWEKCTYLLSLLNNVAGPTQFRFVFTSDASVTYDGFSLDDFSIIPPFANDAGANSIILPDLSGCVPAGSQTIKADFKNYGSQKIVPPTQVAYMLDNLPMVIDTIYDTIHPGMLDTLIFTTPVFLTPGTHKIKLFTRLTGDMFTLNDTVSYTFTAFAPLPLPYFNYLDSAGALNDFCIQTGMYGRAFYSTLAANTGTGGVILDASTTTGWTVYPDTTIGSGIYVWDPATDPDHLASMRLIVNSAGYNALVMKFDAKLLYLYGNNYTNFRVTVNGTMLTPHMMPNGLTSAYITYQFDLTPFLPSNSLVIEFQSKDYATYNYGVPNGTGVYLDNIQIYEPPAQEASVLSMPAPVPGCGLGIEPVKIKIKNTGSQTIHGNLTASYKIGNAPAITPEVITDSIHPGDTLVYIFNTLLNMAVVSSDSTFHIKAWVDLVGDPFQFNDTIVKDVKSMFVPNDPVTAPIVVIPYATDTLLSATSTGNIYWFNSPTSTSYMQMGPNYQTPVLYDTATYYVEARNGSAGTYFFIGTGTIQNSTTTYPTPYGQWFNGSREQFLVPASELGAAGIGPGPMQSLSFNVVTPAGAALTNFTINMAPTNLTNLTGWVTSGFTQVYTISSYATSAGWDEHTFTTPFVWDGISNIVIQTCFDNYPNGYTTNAICNQTTTSYTSTVGYFSDGGNVCPPLTPPSTYTYAQRPNMRFKATSSGCPSNRLPVEVEVSSIPPYDAGVIVIDSPYTAVNLGLEYVAVKIHNFGTSQINNFPVSYKVGNNAAVTETYSGTILPGDTAAYIFTTLANLSVHNTYAFKAWTSLAGDNYHINDTAYKSVTNQVPIYCASGAIYTADDDITNVTFAGINNTSPTPYNGTYTDYTGLSPAHVFLGATYPISVGIGFSGSFGYAGYCEAYIDLNSNGVFTEPAEVVFGSAYASAPLSQTLTGTITIPVTAHPGLTRLRVVAVEGGNASIVVPCGTYYYGETEDYSVIIAPLLHKDIAILGFASPAASASTGTIIPVKTIMQNFGTDTLTTYSVTYKLNGGTPQTYNWTGVMPPSHIDTITIGSITLNTANNALIAYTTLAGDSNTFNDTARTTCFGLPPMVLYLDNFNDSLSHWTTNSGTLWQHGVPASTVINYAHSPTRCWKTRLVGNYTNSRNDYLYSPAFNFTTISGAVLRFWHWVQVDPLDGCEFQYSTNGGTTWITMGYQNDPNGVGWYNTFANGKYFWTGLFTGWKEAIYDLSQFNHAASVKFRYYFYSDATTNTLNGWAVDDFEIRVPKIPKDAGIVAINAPVSPTSGNVYPKVIIHNYGLDTLTSIPVAFVISGGGLIIENWNGHLPPDSNVKYDFTNPYVSPIGNYTFCAFTAIGNDYYKFNDSLCMAFTGTSGIDQYSYYGFRLEQNIPNPAGNFTLIHFYIPEKGRTKFTLTNIFGQLIFEDAEEPESGNHDITLPTATLAPGVYFYSLEYNKQRITRRMLIER